MDWIGKNGWTTTGPAGGNSAWILTAVSGKEGLQVRFTAHAGYETDSPLDPAGGKVEVTHWLDAPPALLE
jgi:hypothetical protein